MSNNLTDFKTWLYENSVLEKYAIPQIGIFGSFVRNEEPNDIDLLLDSPIHYTKIDALKDLVSETWQLPCDIAIKPFIEPIIWHYIQKDLVYVKKQ